ncbi:MAG: hypothetical protein A2498_00890 [Lentisphaerae bacterium RIFOXYC12_FULL_60_16]|nr:MAG: hypothetical protein A2498_00890 [Lentisphaerae bacterium RIFOXYC12_FULL_60_16]
MKTMQELKAMLPPELDGVIGCTEYNARRLAALAAMERAHRFATTALDRDGLTIEAKVNEIGKIAVAETKFSQAVTALNKERRLLLCEPSAQAPSADAIMQSLRVAPLAAKKGTPDAVLNAKIAAFNDRVKKTLKTVWERYNNACAAHSRSVSDGGASPAAIRARNIASAAFILAARPFLAEAKKLNVMLTAMKKQVPQ